MATPFVQGRLRREPLTVRIDSSCAACRRRLAFDLTDQLECAMIDAPDSLLVFEPELDWSTFAAPTIVNDY
jgi:hypothetical protein